MKENKKHVEVTPPLTAEDKEWVREHKRRSRLLSISGMAVVVMGFVAIGIYAMSSRLNGVDSSQSQTVGSSIDPNKFTLSFVTQPNKAVPSWLDGGEGMVVSITIKAWQTADFKNDGFYIIPTATNPSEELSIYGYPDHATPKGFQAAFGGGPASFTDVVNAYLQKRHLAKVKLGQMDYITSIHGTVKNFSLYAVIGSASSPETSAKRRAACNT